MRRPHEASTFGWMVGGSLLAHVAVFGGVLLFVNLTPRFTPPPPNAIMTKLVRLGKPRPKEQLPHLDEPPPPPPPPPPPAAPQAAPAVAPPVPVKTAPQSKNEPSSAANGPTAKDRIQELNRVNKALERLKREADGAADGSAQGDSDVKVLGDQFGTMLQRCMQANYEIQGTDPGKVANLQAMVLVRVAADGKITNFRIEKGSGVAAFDQAVGRAVTRCGKVAPPPPPLRDTLGRDGIEIVFKP